MPVPWQTAQDMLTGFTLESVGPFRDIRDRLEKIASDLALEHAAGRFCKNQIELNLYHAAVERLVYDHHVTLKTIREMMLGILRNGLRLAFGLGRSSGQLRPERSGPAGGDPTGGATAVLLDIILLIGRNGSGGPGCPGQPGADLSGRGAQLEAQRPLLVAER
jgi:hypothetical protein